MNIVEKRDKTYFMEQEKYAKELTIYEFAGTGNFEKHKCCIYFRPMLLV